MMKNERMLDELGNIPDEFVLEAKPKGRRPRFRAVLYAAAALLVAAGVGFAVRAAIKNSRKDIENGRVASVAPAGSGSEAVHPEGETQGWTDLNGTGGADAVPHSITGDVSPDTNGAAARYLAAFPQDAELTPEQRWGYALKAHSTEAFTVRLTETLLGQTEGNVVFSPVSVYTALGMLCEGAEGNTLGEILSVLGEDSLPELRENVRALTAAETVNDGKTFSRFGNSLWMNERYPFLADTLDSLAEHYGAYSYWGDPSDEGFLGALKRWLSEMTGGLLDESTEKIGLDPDMALALFSTVCFRSAWDSPYSEKFTETGVFHTDKGDTECEFMKRNGAEMPCFEGEGFTAVCERTDGGSVWYMLPDEGVSVEEMLEKGGYDFMYSDRNGAENAAVTLSVPKLDIKADTDLIPILTAMGVSSCFDPALSGLNGFTADGSVFVTQAAHSARLVTDEEGVSGAAYTFFETAPTSPMPPEKHVAFTADRPFVVFVTGESGQPLFIGVVRTPLD